MKFIVKRKCRRRIARNANSKSMEKACIRQITSYLRINQHDLKRITCVKIRLLLKSSKNADELINDTSAKLTIRYEKSSLHM